MPRPRAATVLVVDDLESFRVMLRRQLVSLGHIVLEAADGAEAIEVVRSRRGELDLVLTDVVMPAMNGTEVAACICAEYPGLPVVLMSAYAPAGLTRVGLPGRDRAGAAEAVRCEPVGGADPGGRGPSREAGVIALTLRGVGR